MGNWKMCTIADIGTVVGGATPSTKKEENYDGGTIAWITPKDLAGFSGRFISCGERSITEIGLKSCSTQIMPKHTVLFSSRAPIGYIAIASNEVCTNQGFKSVIPNENTDYMFLYYLLKYNKDNIESLGSGTTFKEVSGSTMREIQVKVPESLDEQKSIASILSALDDKIENNEKVNDNLQKQIQSIFLNTFPHAFTEINGTVSELISFSNGRKRPNDEGNIPVYGGNGILAHTNVSNNKNCIIIGRVGAYCGSLYYSSKSCWISDNAISAKSKVGNSQLFSYYLLKNASLSSKHIGTSQPLLTQGILNAIPCNIPKESEINEFNDICTPLQAMVDANVTENIQLTCLRDSILPKLMSGEIDVSDIRV